MHGGCLAVAGRLRVAVAGAIPRGRQRSPAADFSSLAHSSLDKVSLDAHGGGVVSSRHDWQVLYNYAKHLSNDRNELTRSKCITLLLTLSQILLEQSVLRGHGARVTSTYLWNHCTASLAPTPRRHAPTSYSVEPSSLLRYLRYMARLRPYHRLSVLRDGPAPSDDVVSRGSCATTPQGGVGYAGLFSRLMGDDVSPCSVRRSRKVSGSHIGPLRLRSDQLLAHPGIFSYPVYLELIGDEHVAAPPAEGAAAAPDAALILQRSVEQLLDRLRVLYLGHGTRGQQCLVPMFTAVMLYGPKLKLSGNAELDGAYRKLHSSLSNAAISTEGAPPLSFRSLAYLLNSCLHTADTAPICAFAERRISESAELVPLEWLENICFACSKSRYPHDTLYEAMSRHVSAQADSASPVVCLNLLWSFSRVGRAHLVGKALERRIAELGPGAFAHVNPAFLRRAVVALEPHVAESTLQTIRYK
ncbi:hypothetical protein, conserved [Babesia bigemina]|uniref:RAP domain-containing protein n=1 Tax=Babesia bigemina TaxID=5866 RepID=A0A061D2I1_BABBI|nr:hypothetical protein, conserved [Babesia bigemina]CDR94986.1 hypothetical protein, conserved [Babesia bigemina]|eukprot:XP_012767172.1 hypothetical protein, conserved [Babesia bigemina]